MPQMVSTASYGNVKYAKVAVLASAATLLTAGSVTGEAATGHNTMSSLGDRKNITIENLGPNDIYIGSDASVTTATGFKVPANGGTFAADYGSRVTLYAIAATADQVSPADTRVLEAY